MTVQFIKTPDGQELAVIPRSDYEDLVDARMVDDAARSLASGREETLSSDEMRALLAAPTPLAFWRAKRQVPVAKLAEIVGESEADLSDLENGSRHASLSTYRRAAEALGLSLDDLAAD